MNTSGEKGSKGRVWGDHIKDSPHIQTGDFDMLDILLDFAVKGLKLLRCNFFVLTTTY